MEHLNLEIKKSAICLMLITVMLTGCTTQSKQGVTQDKPIEKALTEVVAISKAKEKAVSPKFPDTPGKVEGVVYGGGPAPGMKYPAEFETKVEKEGNNSYTVTFTERWTDNNPNQTGPMSSHSWKYKVTSSDVQLTGHSGDFPPQSMK